MSNYEDRHLDFVLKHWQSGRFDTNKAIEGFRARTGQTVSRIRPLWHRAVISVAAAAVFVLGLFIFHQRTGWTELVSGGSSLSQVLPDGTQVTLAPGSGLRFKEKAFDKGKRDVRMEGKVFFDVTPDSESPFEVRMDGAFLRVLGTEFQVAETAGGKDVEVYVQSGKVLFAKSDRAEGVILTEGMGAKLVEGAQIPKVEEVSKTNSIAWSRGTFVFDQTPLKQVLDELGAYYGVSFATTYPDRQLSGEFGTDDLDLIIELIESALDVTIIRNR